MNADDAQEAMLAGFRGGETPLRPKTCPTCGQPWPDEEVTVRVTESTVVEATDAKKPYENVEYADPGYQADGNQRYPLDTEDRVRSAWSYINKPANAKKYEPDKLKKVRAKIKAAMKRLDIAVSECSVSEAMINGSRSWDDIREMIRRAVRAKLQDDLDRYVWVYIVDVTDTDLVYMAEGDKLFQCTWSLSGDEVTLGEPVEVERTYAPVSSVDDTGESVTEAVREAVEHDARVIEAKGTDGKGNRIFRVRLISTGTSKNGTRYTEAVLSAAAHLYDGAKAYDHHRTEEEMQTSTIDGLVGYYSNVTATAEGLDADFHVFPSAVRAAEALDAALKVKGETPFVGFSHDVYGKFTPVQEAGRMVQEATEITAVNSVDIVARPSAGGKVTRAVAGGITPPEGAVPPESTKESEDVKTEDVLAALKEATDDQLAAVGLAKAGDTTQKTEADDKSAEKVTEAVGEPKDSFLGKLLIKQKVEDAGLPASAVESVTKALPDRITESHVDTQIAAVKDMLGGLERAGLVPTVTAQVTQESLDKKIAALDAFFAADYRKGYRSFKEAFSDFTGRRPKSFDEDFNKTILRESIGHYDSAERTTESMSSATWNLVLGDSITRRMVAEYAQPSLQTWRSIISSSIPVNDFRTQRIDRIGGYGTLPGVNQGAPYQPLTSPTNEEVTYAITKRGGTEDITLEMIANDDVRAIQRIPGKLGLAAAQTVFRFIWDMLDANANIYDGVALFHASHSNTATNALSQSNLSAARLAMRSQAAYGDTTNILSLLPKTLVVVNDLEEIAFQLCTSAVAIPATPAGPTDTPNLHQGLAPIVVDYWTSTTKWITVADPTLCPTIEMGWYQGREDPELFTQSDPSVGSVFDSDKVTYKIRHIYSGAVLDYRGMYRGNV